MAFVVGFRSLQAFGIVVSVTRGSQGRWDPHQAGALGFTPLKTWKPGVEGPGCSARRLSCWAGAGRH